MDGEAHVVIRSYSQQAWREQTAFMPKRVWENEMKMNVEILILEDVE
jgi:hypothetical protein